MKELLTTPAGVLALWLIVINLATFAVYGIDKSRAKRGVWRVPEKTLFLLPLLGGSIGALLGMRTFRHKTKHWYFVWGIPGDPAGADRAGGMAAVPITKPALRLTGSRFSAKKQVTAPLSDAIMPVR